MKNLILVKYTSFFFCSFLSVFVVVVVVVVVFGGQLCFFNLWRNFPLEVTCVFHNCLFILTFFRTDLFYNFIAVFVNFY